ncbi:MAG: 6,7-dimethyl-8-ribityllumazine synthase, partial [Chromatiales bacterium]
MSIKTIEGAMTVSKARFCLVAARFNSFIVESLVDGAVDTLKRHGASEKDITLVRVPGAFEMPVVLEKLAVKGEYDAIIAL